MSFLASNFLFLLPLVAFPIIIHLLKKQSYIEVNFSTLKFFNIIQSDSIKKNNITNIILLIIRTLALLTIIFILSKPIYNSSNYNSTQDSHVTIIIDNTVSNYINVNNKFHKFINSLNEIYNSNTDFDFYYFGDSNPFYSGKLSNLNFQIINYYTPSIKNLRKHLLSYNKIEKHNKDLIFFSDFTDPQINKEIITEISTLDDYSIYFYKPTTSLTNLSLSDFTIDNTIIIPNEIVSIKCKINNNLQDKIFNKNISLYTNNIKVGSLNIDLEPNESKTIEFKTSYSDYGNNLSYISINDDDYDLDNNFYFNVNLPDNYNITVLSENSNESYFIENFINAFNQKYKNINSNFLNYNEFMSYDNYNDDILFIIGYSYLTSESLIKIKNSNAKVIIVPDISYTNNPNIHALLDDNSLENSKKIEMRGDSYLSISNNIKDTFFATFLNEENSNRNIKVYKYIDLKSNKNTIVELNNNAPLINKYKINNNIFYLFTSGYNLNDSNLPIKGLFIPLIYNLINTESKTSYTFDEIAFFDYSKHFNNSIEIKHEDQKYITDIPIINYSKYFSKPGFYNVKDNNNKIVIPINVNSKENPKFISDIEIKKNFNNYSFFTNYNNFISTLKNTRNDVDLRSYLIYFLCFLLILEMLLSNIYLNDKKK